MIIMPERLQEIMDELKIVSAETYYHSIHVKSYVYKMIKLMNEDGFTDYTKSEIECICKGALLHDVGKLYVKNVILTKTSSLTDEEREKVVEHTRLGFDAVKDSLTRDELGFVQNICLYHHERIDGSGYVGKTDLFPYVQAVAACDVFDALTTVRIYREALTREEALGMIKRGRCGAFDERIVGYLERITEE